ncbi:hypothetical protein TTHERM_00373830 (macronuclear) [Tetrahymena thermophila SB210]|uniref:Uncharacterized protein n=1 Tax=Tetrahymena thermophila (strain SB210) TaxID=312017 RepID=I7M0L9_TETTS|nr:hypothetical protein TTHERM_00373830 [Tetrahymena thermophila SB210]EAR89366.2 hypothetical protein TTHERM_00373830 [Tetrahymena thermophila SB210]|eukprot:XP_001009611.2 hypothetical protein TTHERM_00373830 [Tetrahymena thermophila SB210]
MNRSGLSPNGSTKYDSYQKDVLISTLQAQIFEMRQNEKDFQELNHHLKNLEHRYNILSEEKSRNEIDARNKQAAQAKTISIYKNDIETLKQSLTEKHIELQELRAENMAVKEISDRRQLDIQRLKNELQHTSDSLQRVNNERNILEQELSYQKDENRKLRSEKDQISNTCETLIQKNAQQEKLIAELDQDRELQEQERVKLFSQIDQLQVELQNVQESVRFNNLQINDKDSQINQLQNEVQELQSIRERLRSDNNNLQRNLQNENSKGLEYISKISALESSLKTKEQFIDELKRDLDKLNLLYSERNENVDALQLELETYKRSYEGLVLQNQKVIQEMESFQDQDERVRSILNRRSIVRDLRQKHDNFIRQSQNDASYGRNALSPTLQGSKVNDAY